MTAPGSYEKEQVTATIVYSSPTGSVYLRQPRVSVQSAPHPVECRSDLLNDRARVVCGGAVLLRRRLREPVKATTPERIHRKSILNGLINEYTRAA